MSGIVFVLLMEAMNIEVGNACKQDTGIAPAEDGSVEDRLVAAWDRFCADAAGAFSPKP